MSAPAVAPVTSGWHAGEQALHQRAGVGERMAAVGAHVLRDHMPQQHRDFFALLPVVVAGTVDTGGQPWVSLLAGPPGFAHSPDPVRLRIDAQAGARGIADAHLRVGAPIGLLGLQAHTRRRNRMNGWVDAVDAAGFTVRVGQSFGNCPKYIHPREALFAPAAGPAVAQVLAGLDEEARALVTRADTFFIASAHPAATGSTDPRTGVDVSHRGGPPGFVRIGDDDALRVPDYVGNSFFNTLGNLQLEPRCALLFVDFESGTQLHLLARAQLLWGGEEVSALPGALRVLRLEVQQAMVLRGGLPVQWREG
jgi:predicted pyridoxine 5'-phosphate oxidase superfamily flavin-nucleotide-binding protein